MGKQLIESWIHVLSQNMRGMVRDEHVEEFDSWFKCLKAYAACLQETWKLGNTTEEHDGTLILNHGPPAKLCKRGSLGVAIVLNGKARKDWERAGSIVLYFGMRIIATRLHLTDPKGKVVKLFIASAYAPVGAAPNEEREEYANHLQQCINACAKDEVLIIGTV